MNELNEDRHRSFPSEGIFLAIKLTKVKHCAPIYHCFLRMEVDGIAACFSSINIRMGRSTSLNLIEHFPAIGKVAWFVQSTDILLFASRSVSLEKRTFRTLDFFNQHCKHLRPVGLAFFQTAWDSSVTDLFHNLLGWFLSSIVASCHESYFRNERASL